MRKKIKLLHKITNTEVKEHLSADTYYPASDDIFIAGEKESNINLENISSGERLTEIVKHGKSNEIKVSDNLPGSDLDVPGSDLDDQDEAVGSEDEENNYYSIGGDGHNDLDEDFRE